MHAGQPPLSGDGETQVPQSFEEESVIQRALHFLFGVAAGPTATGDGGLALTCTLHLLLITQSVRVLQWL